MLEKKLKELKLYSIEYTMEPIYKKEQIVIYIDENDFSALE